MGRDLQESLTLQAANGNHRWKQWDVSWKMGLNMHHRYTKGLTGRTQGGWCSMWCPNGEGVVSACMDNQTPQGQILFPWSPTLHRQTNLWRNFCVLCRSTSVPPRTPVMNYFTGTAPLCPQYHALMPAPWWMPQQWQRPLSQQALKHPAPERRVALNVTAAATGIAVSPWLLLATWESMMGVTVTAGQTLSIVKSTSKYLPR